MEKFLATYVCQSVPRVIILSVYESFLGNNIYVMTYIRPNGTVADRISWTNDEESAVNFFDKEVSLDK